MNFQINRMLGKTQIVFFVETIVETYASRYLTKQSNVVIKGRTHFHTIQTPIGKEKKILIENLV